MNLKQAYIFCCGNDLRHYTRRLCDVLCFIILETYNLFYVSTWVALCINRWERLIQVFAYACVGYFLHTQVIHVSMYYWKSDTSLCAGYFSEYFFYMFNITSMWRDIKHWLIDWLILVRVGFCARKTGRKSDSSLCRLCRRGLYYNALLYWMSVSTFCMSIWVRM